MEYLWAFLIGGAFCAVGQILIDLTAMTPARILVTYVVTGVLLGALGIYEPIVGLAGAGATVPLTGFGYNLAKGVRTAVISDGLVGSLTGGLEACAGGITAAVIFALVVALFFSRGDKTAKIIRG
ncbi:MAG: stage V sporulation protein AE [Ruminiclostridium sp.]|nr:stage V sporulation protein AE [Ruminiclostridium sp.]